MERKIGEVFRSEGITLQVEIKDGCGGCHYTGNGCTKQGDLYLKAGPCSSYLREDGIGIIFVKVKPEHINDITDPKDPEPQMSYE